MSIPLIMLTLVEQQLFLARSRRRAPPATIGSTGVATSGALPANAAAHTTAVPAASSDVAASAPPLSEHGGGGNTGGLASILIRLDCAWLLLLMGIHVRAEGLNERSLSRPAMLLFTHTSTLDAVVILGTLPRALCAVVKVCGRLHGSIVVVVFCVLSALVIGCVYATCIETVNCSDTEEGGESMNSLHLCG